MSSLDALGKNSSVVAMIRVAIGIPTLLELIASTGVFAIGSKRRAERIGVFDVFVTKGNLLNNYRPINFLAPSIAHPERRRACGHLAA